MATAMARRLVTLGQATLGELEELSIDDVDDQLIWQDAWDDAERKLAKRLREERQ